MHRVKSLGSGGVCNTDTDEMVGDPGQCCFELVNSRQQDATLAPTWNYMYMYKISRSMVVLCI